MKQKVYSIGIRLEDYKKFESRSPLTPSDVYDLLKFQHKNSLKIYVQKSRTEEQEVNAVYVDEAGNAHETEKIIQLPRYFVDRDFLDAGAILVDKFPAECKVILGIKEIPHRNYFDKFNQNKVVLEMGFEPGKTYCYFSHTFKGQKYNEGMFMEMISQGCSLVDYEMIVENASEEKFNAVRAAIKSSPIQAPAPSKTRVGNRDYQFIRTVYFGKFAGIVGTINSLWLLGQRLKYEGISTPLANLKQAKDYKVGRRNWELSIGDHHRNIQDYDRAKGELKKVAKELTNFEVPDDCPPFIIGITGKSKRRSEKSHSLVLGHSAVGAKEIVDIFEGEEIKNPSELLTKTDFQKGKVYVVYFDSDHTAKQKFEKYFPKLTVLVNCLTWEPGVDRLVTAGYLKQLYSKRNGEQFWHRIISDVSCDPGGSIEMSKDIYSTDPMYIYEPHKDVDPNLRWSNDEPGGKNDFDTLFRSTCTYGTVEGIGPVITSITNLPCELPGESSREFSYMLKDFVLDLSKISEAPLDFKDLYEEYDMARPIKRAIMIYRGKVTPDYAYLLNEYGSLREYHRKNPCVWNC